MLDGFTPGPWRVHSSRFPGVVVTDREDEQSFTGVADCRTVDVDSDTAAANARLVAKAPELHAALAAILAAWERYPGSLHRDLLTAIEDGRRTLRSED